MNQRDQIIHAVESFLSVFSRLEWSEFIRFFDEHASVFFPFEDTPQRVEGIENVLERFAAFFDQTRRSKVGPDFLGLQPLDLQIDLMGDSALVTFHLRNGDHLSRRTILLIKRPAGWLIRHLHASRILTSGNTTS